MYSIHKEVLFCLYWLCIYTFMCKCVGMCMCVGPFVCVGIHIWRPEEDMGVFLSHSPLCYLKQGLFLNPKFTDFSRLAVQGAQGSSCLSFPSFGAQVQTYVMGTGDPHSGPQASTASKLRTEPSLQSWHDCFKSHLGGFVVRLSLRAEGLACFSTVVRHITGTETFYTTDLAKLVKGICRGLISLNFNYFQDKAASVVLV